MKQVLYDLGIEKVDGIVLDLGVSSYQLEAMRAKKANERGGFKEKIFLEHVEEKR